MARYVRNSVILAGLQTAVGTELTTMTGAANAMLVSDLTISPFETTPIDRGLLRQYFGSSEQLAGEINKKIEFTVELAGTGATTGLGIAPGYDALLQACAMVGVSAQTPTRYSYNPISTTLRVASIRAFDDGVLHRYVDAMGDAEIMMVLGEKPQIKFSFMGRDIGPASDAAGVPPADVSTGYARFKVPLAVTSINSARVTLGGTIAAGVVTGGVPYLGTGIKSLKFGNSLQFTPLLGGSAVDITDRKTQGTIELDLTAAEEVAVLTAVRNNTQQPLSMLHGTATGGKVLIWHPAVQLFSPKKIEKNGRRQVSFDYVAMPVLGNDETQLHLL